MQFFNELQHHMWRQSFGCSLYPFLANLVSAEIAAALNAWRLPKP